jgi:hypothetical protein
MGRPRSARENPSMLRSAVAQSASIALFSVCAYALVGQPALADVTIQEQSTYDLSLITAHGTSTELISGDKQRRDSEIHCDGLMSLLCRNTGGGVITRLDKDVIWTLSPKDKEYTETHFPTPAERQAAEEKMRAALEKLKQCPARPNSNAPDTSKCQMTPPKIESHQTDKHLSIAGHDARLSQLSLTTSCHTPNSTDSCDFVITLDSWLTQDEIPGMADRKAFAEAQMKKLGLTDPNGSMQKMLQQFLAPYRDSLKELSAKAQDFKGYPLKTSIRILYGGAQCAAAKNATTTGGAGGTVGDAGSAAGQAAASSSSGEAQSAANQAATNAAGNGVAGRIFGSAAGAFTNKLASGLFAKKPASTPAATPAADTPPNMVQFALITIETTSIIATPIPADQFEIPAGWKLITPKARAEGKEVSCPTT